jgi:hypothetical protein
MTTPNLPRGDVIQKLEDESLTKTEKQPTVSLIITDNTGAVLDSIPASVNAELAARLFKASRFDDPDKPVRRDENTLSVLGKDFYVVSRDYVLLIRGIFYPERTWSDITAMEKTMPATATYTFAVAY